jgi:eukaryotic-like serine/threonine-protein kinase
MPARQFGQYEVLARLATGGAANIFLARQPGAGGFKTLVCLKTLLPERASDEEFVAMFLDEARLAARLSHPNCVEIYDLGKEGGTFYISMEYILGETLWGLLSSVAEIRQPLPPLVVATILASTCEGLHHAHELTDPQGRPYNLVHRDVSPQNIMISYEGQTKVLDFGIAKAETGREATATGIVKGKFSYMSPEQITGGVIDRRSDIYSLGIVMFECLASRRLYRADTPEEIARMMLEKRPPRLRDLVPDVDPTLEAICGKALARHPSNRFSTAREMADALRELLHSQRFPDGTAPVARLVEERFSTRIAERRRIFGLALEGKYNETELLMTLNARPVLEIDLFPSLDMFPSGPIGPDATEALPPEELERAMRAEALVGGGAGKKSRMKPEVVTQIELDSGETPAGDGPPDRRRTKEIERLDLSGANVPQARRLRDAPTRPLPKPPSESLPAARPRQPSRPSKGQQPAATKRSDPQVARVSPPKRLQDEVTVDPTVVPPSMRNGPSKRPTSGSQLLPTPPPPLGPPVHEKMQLPIDTGPPSDIAEAAEPPEPPPQPYEREPLAAYEAAPQPMAFSPQSAEAPVYRVPPGYYSLGVVLAALAFGVTLGLLLGVLVSMFR